MSGATDYWEALERLKQNKPTKVSPGSRINKDTVALEAGRKRGSIKNSRAAFSDLIAAIENAAASIAHPELTMKDKLGKEKAQKASYRELYHQALNRELMLLQRVAELEKQLKNTATPYKT